jgi:hypothetical protein
MVKHLEVFGLLVEQALVNFPGGVEIAVLVRSHRRFEPSRQGCGFRSGVGCGFIRRDPCAGARTGCVWPAKMPLDPFPNAHE